MQLFELQNNVDTFPHGTPFLSERMTDRMTE